MYEQGFYIGALTKVEIDEKSKKKPTKSVKPTQRAHIPAKKSRISRKVDAKEKKQAEIKPWKREEHENKKDTSNIERKRRMNSEESYVPEENSAATGRSDPESQIARRNATVNLKRKREVEERWIVKEKSEQSLPIPGNSDENGKTARSPTKNLENEKRMHSITERDVRAMKELEECMKRLDKKIREELKRRGVSVELVKNTKSREEISTPKTTREEAKSIQRDSQEREKSLYSQETVIMENEEIPDHQLWPWEIEKSAKERKVTEKEESKRRKGEEEDHLTKKRKKPQKKEILVEKPETLRRNLKWMEKKEIPRISEDSTRNQQISRIANQRTAVESNEK